MQRYIFPRTPPSIYPILTRRGLLHIAEGQRDRYPARFGDCLSPQNVKEAYVVVFILEYLLFVAP